MIFWSLLAVLATLLLSLLRGVEAGDVAGEMGRFLTQNHGIVALATFLLYLVVIWSTDVMMKPRSRYVIFVTAIAALCLAKMNDGVYIVALTVAVGGGFFLNDWLNKPPRPAL